LIESFCNQHIYNSRNYRPFSDFAHLGEQANLQ